MYQQDWKGLSEEQIRDAVVALKKLSSDENSLWASDSPVQLQFGFQYLEDISKKLRPKLIEVPHQIYPETTSVCLIVRNECPPQLMQTLKSQLGKVITLSKLKRNYHDVEEKSKLCGRFDLFLYDKRLPAQSLPHVCGKVFLEKKKNPISITVRTVGGVLNEIERVKQCALYFKNGGVSTTIKAARFDFTDEQIVENITAVLSKMHKFVDPVSVQSISIKTTDSIALPVYQCAVQQREAKKIKTNPPAGSVPAEEESHNFFKKIERALQNDEYAKQEFGI